MSTWAASKLLARRTVHETFAFAFVFHQPGQDAAVPADVVSVRVHDKSKMVGDLAGTNLSYAEVAERPTEAVFLVEELEGRVLSRGVMIVGFDYTGAIIGYFVDNVMPRDGLTQTCGVTPMRASEMTGLLLPDGSTVI